MASPVTNMNHKQGFYLALGTGRTGSSVVDYFGSKARCIEVHEVTTASVKSWLENNPVIVVSPGIKPNNRHLVWLKDHYPHLVFRSDIDLFMEQVQVPVAGVTGTNGKSTVCHLTQHILQENGYQAVVAGNIGIPCLQALKESEQVDCWILELSSFQLYYSQPLPLEVSCILNIEPDHLDWHGDMQSYETSKLKIHQLSKAKLGNMRYPNTLDSHSQTSFSFQEVEDTSLKPMTDRWLPMWKENYQAAHAIAYLLFNRPLVALERVDSHIVNQRQPAISVGMFENLSTTLDLGKELRKDRSEIVKVTPDLTGYQASKATNPHASLATLDWLIGFWEQEAWPKNLTIVFGGDPKGIKLSSYAEEARKKVEYCPNVQLVVYGIAARQHEMEQVSDKQFNSLKEVFENEAEAWGKLPDHWVLLVPAAASIDEFPNYQARGQFFLKQLRSSINQVAL